MVATSSKKRNQAYGGVWQSLHLMGVRSLESDSRFSVGAYGRNLASVTVKMFSHLIYFIKIL
jgi:hypothetical protein